MFLLGVPKSIPKSRDIFVAFTPDEEIGEGTKYFDFSKFKADFSYTIDGSELGEIYYENFNAATIKIQIKGVSTHLGSAKNILVNSQLIANEIINLLPKEYPETTEGYERYYHLDSIHGNVTNTKIKFLVRDFQKVGFEQRKKEFFKTVNDLNKKYNNCITIEISDTCYNMKEIISKHMHLIENAKKAPKAFFSHTRFVITPKTKNNAQHLVFVLLLFFLIIILIKNTLLFQPFFKCNKFCFLVHSHKLIVSIIYPHFITTN